MIIRANFVDVFHRKIFPAEVHVANGVIVQINPIEVPAEHYILPGFVDAHVHIESSLMVPSQFATMAVQHGTVATVSDPHEIANVLGVDGVKYMIEEGKTVPFKFFFGAPSCVPATNFETAGAVIGVDEVKELLSMPEVKYLTEMMNYPGVLFDDADVWAKINAAHQVNKVVDGHAPGLRGDELKKYLSAGITTDHECFTLDEALEKLDLGMKVLIREGSAARNFNDLIPALHQYPQHIMFCSDDKHPDSLLEGHINLLCKRAIELGYSLFDVLRAACVHPVLHYQLPVGLLRIGEPADFILVNNLTDFKVIKTVVNGIAVFENGEVLFDPQPAQAPNQFNIQPIISNDLSYEPEHEEQVIVCYDGQLITGKETVAAHALTSQNHIHKIVVVNRYAPAKVAVAYVKNFGLTKGAIASSVAHDSHNIVAVGCDDESLCLAINEVIKHKGGLSATDGKNVWCLPLPVAGLMSNEPAPVVTEKYIAIDKVVKEKLGSGLRAPFMSLSFMALLVIPHLKLSDLGLFDGDGFTFIRRA